MDVSTAPRSQAESNATASSQTLSASTAVGNSRAFTLAPPRRTSPLRHGIAMGLATAGSVALLYCSLLAVAGYLGPGRRILNSSIVVVSVLAGLYTGFRAWLHQKAPRPVYSGRCLDCGRELIGGQDHCSLCGRPVGQLAR